MIIQSIYAENFRRYTQLSIEKIPMQGVITVDGANEAGKSTISDALCFALFGRTFSIQTQNANKLVNWQAEYCVTKINFRKSGKYYSLTRRCDKEGHSSAQLFDNNKRILAASLNEVNKQLKLILGYDYSTFADSFYLMQKELTVPNKTSLKNMVGINQYYHLIEECIASNRKIKQQLRQLQPQLEQHDQDIAIMKLDETWLPDLVEGREILETLNHKKQKYLHLLDQTLNVYPHDRIPYRKMLPRYRLINGLTNLLLPVLIMVWLWWTGLEFFPQWMAILPALPFDMPEVNNSSLLKIGLTIAASYTACLSYSWWLDGNVIDPLRKKGKEIQAILNATFKHIEYDMDDIPKRIKVMLLEKAQTPSLLPQVNVRKVMGKQFIKKLSQYHYNRKQAHSALKEIQHILIRQRNHISYHQSLLNTAIDQEMQRTHRAGNLRKEYMQIKRHIQQHQRHRKVNIHAINLLDTAAQKFLTQFNQVITKNSSRMLPSFTNGRYSQIKIDKNLKVSIYANQIADFIDFDEVSSGTQRQIMLSLRFAMSEQLAVNKDNQHQFILLDEPFAFFDQQRSRETLLALPEVSPIVNQVWVFSQEFPKIEVAKTIHCNTNSTELYA